MQEIKLSCQTKDYLYFDDLVEFQGNLKFRNKNDIDKIVRSILKYGFSFPFFVWKKDDINYVLDGHGRYKALQELDNLGYNIPKLPVVYVDCKDERSAKDLLLRLNSQYGKITKESALEFIGDLDLDLSEFDLFCGSLDELDMELDNDELDKDDESTGEIEVVCKFDNLQSYKKCEDELKNKVEVAGGKIKVKML